jgi:hypothetical protein
MAVTLDKTKLYFFYNPASPGDNSELLTSLDDQTDVVAVPSGPSPDETATFKEYTDEMDVDVPEFPSIVYWKPTRQLNAIANLSTNSDDEVDPPHIRFEEIGGDERTWYVSEWATFYYGGSEWQTNNGGWVCSSGVTPEKPYTWTKLRDAKDQDLSEYSNDYRLFVNPSPASAEDLFALSDDQVREVYLD